MQIPSNFIPRIVKVGVDDWAVYVNSLELCRVENKAKGHSMKRKFLAFVRYLDRTTEISASNWEGLWMGFLTAAGQPGSGFVPNITLS